MFSGDIAVKMSHLCKGHQNAQWFTKLDLADIPCWGLFGVLYGEKRYSVFERSFYLRVLSLAWRG